MQIVVAGQGYVGLPLAVRAAEVGHRVVDYDVDPHHVQQLAAGQSYVRDVDSSGLRAVLGSGAYSATADAAAPAGFDIAVITVPTPLRDGLPDLTCIESCARTLGDHFALVRRCKDGFRSAISLDNAERRPGSLTDHPTLTVSPRDWAVTTSDSSGGVAMMPEAAKPPSGARELTAARAADRAPAPSATPQWRCPQTSGRAHFRRRPACAQYRWTVLPSADRPPRCEELRT
jgi:hypothetical protein